jgi:hypothetical protein
MLRSLLTWIERLEAVAPTISIKGWKPAHAERLAACFLDAHTAVGVRTGGNNDVALRAAHAFTEEYRKRLEAGDETEPPTLTTVGSDTYPTIDDDEPDARAAAEIDRLLTAVGYDPAAPFIPYREESLHGDT